MTNRSLRTSINALRIAAATAIALSVPGLASATVLIFNGTPTYEGVAPGTTLVDRSSTLSGSIDFSNDALSGAFTRGDVRDFEVHLGGIDFSLADASREAALSGSVSNDGTALNSLHFGATSSASNADCAGCSLNLDLGFPTSGQFFVGFNSLSGGSGHVGGFYTSAAQTESSGGSNSGGNDVPEPSTWLMFGLGLALLGFGVRKRHAA